MENVYFTFINGAKGRPPEPKQVAAGTTVRDFVRSMGFELDRVDVTMSGRDCEGYETITGGCTLVMAKRDLDGARLAA